ncbi:hypothetical protein [Acholeplasma hippikon]|uniref:Uncharacterized protein n=1 Tax=Acholeplasma hippikon TaxID=264636 RepID=A0A449BI60_9MOLU|nr:hypothetical protein [Acholeplasma hippikon]VEU82130.1 Uncharacterised protein [Acholeplasma hippikon]
MQDKESFVPYEKFQVHPASDKIKVEVISIQSKNGFWTEQRWSFDQIDDDTELLNAKCEIEYNKYKMVYFPDWLYILCLILFGCLVVEIFKILN